MIRARLSQLGAQLGPLGNLALWLLGAGTLFLVLVLNPLEARDAELAARLAQNRDAVARSGGEPRKAPAEQLASFYRFFKGGDDVTDSIVKLAAAGRAAGLELRAADYRLKETGTPLGRYEIALPVSGSYARIRGFLKTALAEMPALSLDRVDFTRKRSTDAVVHADLRFTLYLVKP